MDVISHHTMLMPDPTDFGPPVSLAGLLEQFPSMTADRHEGTARKYRIPNRSALFYSHYKASRTYDCVHYKASSFLTSTELKEKRYIYVYR